MKKKEYIKPEIVVIETKPNNLMFSSCICNNCQCDHNNDSGHGGNNSQAHCSCSNRPKSVPMIEDELNW